MTKIVDKRLRQMLSVKRPHGSESEQMWVNKFIKPYDPTVFDTVKGEPMVYAVSVGESETIFSCHVDTVHREGGYQKVMYDQDKDMYYKKDGKPLGADNAAGCWILLEMIDRKIPGLYLFHRGEECGGVGSGWFAMNHDKFLGNYKRAIAFDRKATHSIITHQGWSRCCSEVFGEALASALNSADDTMEFMYVTDDTGIYTDTAEYVEAVPECTNVSVGYYDEHTGSERLYLPHLFALRDAVMKVDWENLPTVRVAGASDVGSDWKGWKISDKNKSKITPTISTVGHYTKSTLCSMLMSMSRSQMDDMAYEDPETFVDAVRAYIYDEGDDDYETEYEQNMHDISSQYGDHLSLDERDAMNQALARDSEDDVPN